MTGLVEEIQRDALNDKTPVSTLLRKVKLAAVKLQLPMVEEWVDHELKGYGTSPVPAYRKFYGTPKAFNPYRGWIPIMGDAKTVETISKISDAQPVASIEDLLSDDEGGVFQKPLSPRVIQTLNDSMDVPLGEMVNFIGRGHLVNIIDQVRNMVLDWAIELEKAGIKGEGMSFKEEEKIAAQSNPQITIGSVGSFVGQVGNHNQIRDIKGGDINAAQVASMANQLKLHQTALVDDGADEELLNSAVEGLLIEAEKPDPDVNKLRSLLTDARAALAGAAGNLMASGALTVIRTLLGG